MNIDEIINLVNKPQKYSIHSSQRDFSYFAKILGVSRQYVHETFNKAIYKLKNKKRFRKIKKYNKGLLWVK